jgi:hypothetical protein
MGKKSTRRIAVLAMILTGMLACAPVMSAYAEEEALESAMQNLSIHTKSTSGIAGGLNSAYTDTSSTTEGESSADTDPLPTTGEESSVHTGSEAVTPELSVDNSRTLDMDGVIAEVRAPSEDISNRDEQEEESRLPKADIDVSGPKVDIEGPELDLKGPKVDIKEPEIQEIESAIEEDKNGGDDAVEIEQAPDKVEVLIEFPDQEVEVDLPNEEWHRFIRYEEEKHPEEVSLIEKELEEPSLMSVEDSAVFLEQLEEFFIEEDAAPLATAEAETETTPVSSVPKTGVAGTASAAVAASISAALLLRKRRSTSGR